MRLLNFGDSLLCSEVFDTEERLADIKRLMHLELMVGEHPFGLSSYKIPAITEYFAIFRRPPRIIHLIP
jgi:hypothetical protein